MSSIVLFSVTRSSISSIFEKKFSENSDSPVNSLGVILISDISTFSIENISSFSFTCFFKSFKEN